VRKALQEADKWTTLTTEIEDLMDAGDLAAISAKLTAIQGSLKILSKVPDYEERVAHVESLKNRLEAMSSPRLVASLAAGDADRARLFAKLFSDMERGPQMLKYYRKCLRDRVLKMWPEAVGGSAALGGQEESLLEWAAVFFEGVEALAREQKSWFRSVFGPTEDSREHLVQVTLNDINFIYYF